MQTLPKPTEAEVAALATERTLDRAEDYVYDGTVYGLTWRRDTLNAEVEGSSYEPYTVTISFEGDQINMCQCTCPYYLDGECKHVIATLLTLIREPERVAIRPPLDELLDRLDQDQLRQLVEGLIQVAPKITDEVEKLANALAESSIEGADSPANNSTASPAPSSSKLTAMEITLLRRQIVSEVAGSIQEGYDGWGEEAWYNSDLSAGLQPGLNSVKQLLEEGQAQDALDALQVITQAWEEGVDQLDDYFIEYFEDGESMELIELGKLWAEALLTLDLSPEKREEWAEQINLFAEEVLWGNSLEIGTEAARQGWDYPPLQAVLGGQITEKGAWAGEVPFYADDLAEVRIRVLERQGEYQKALYLAEAEGRYLEYLILLIKLGRVEESITEAKQELESVQAMHKLAQTLVEVEELEQAFDLARHGLGLEQTQSWLGMGKANLAIWLRDLAVERQDDDMALWAARQALTHQCGLTNYEALQRIAGEEWPAIKPNVLSQIATSQASSGLVDIYLSEGMHDEAIAVVDRASWFTNIEQVLDAVQSTHPEWAFRECAMRANEIMDVGQSKDYDVAANWVRRGRDILLAAGLDHLWEPYINNLMDVHARKYKLMPMLRALVE